MNNKNLTCPRYFLFTLILVTLFSSQLPTASAQEPEGPTEPPPEEVSCGSIITPEETVEITDCSNPFGAMSGTNPFTLRVGGIVVGEGDSVTVSESGTNTYSIETPNYMFGSGNKFFLREGGDYILVESEPFEAVEEDYRRIAVEYFGDEVSFEPYVQREMGNFADTEDEAWDWDLYYGYSYYFNENFVPSRPPLVPGDYTLVSTEMIGYSSQNDVKPLLQKFLDFVIPTAYAQYYSAEPVYVLNFTLTVEDAEPEGASSVLFLPGMQASRLYKDGLVFTEDQLWVPNVNQDMAQLKMRADGSSENDVYTRDIIDEVFGFGTVYKDFTTNLDSLISDNKISDWKSFAYDWRFSVEDIARTGTKYENEIKNATDLFLSLVEESKSGKVTIVGHSNGGLLAKAIIDELVNSGEEEKIDALILLASPQLGTPKAIGALLHGFDQDLAGGLLVSANLARDVAENMPGAYGLLPTEEYMESYDTAPVRFMPGDATSIFSAYGEDIDSQIELDQFLTSQLDSRTSAESVYDASVLNENLLNETRLFQSKIGKSWRAPQNVEVIEVVGVGLPTVSGFEYRNYYESVCSQQLFSESCVTNTIYKPVPIFSLWGDQTVITNSAEGYGGNKETYYFDLRSYRPVKKVEHSNFTEAKAVQELVRNILLKQEVVDIDFISDSKPNQTTGDYYVFGSHSPVSLSIKDKQGRITEVLEDGDFYQTIEDIPGSSVYYHGSTTYLVVPFNEDYAIEILGIGTGAVTLDIDTINNGNQVNQNHIFIDYIKLNSKATFALEGGEFSDISFDLDGDDIIDYTYKIDTGLRQIVDTPTEMVRENNSSQTKVGVKKYLLKPEPLELTSAVISDINIDYYPKMYTLLVQLSDLLKLYAERNKN